MEGLIYSHGKQWLLTAPPQQEQPNTTIQICITIKDILLEVASSLILASAVSGRLVFVAACEKTLPGSPQSLLFVPDSIEA